MACFVCGFFKNRLAHILTSRTRVLIQAASTVIGLFIFALLPSAKTLVVTSAFLGIALGIHDYYYIYVLYLICNGNVRTNLRKLAEYTVYLGAGLLLPVVMIAFMVNNVRITFLALSVIIAILAFIYPLSSYAGKIDERDLSLKPQKAKREKQPAPAAAQASAVVMPDGTVAAAPQDAFNVAEEQYVPEEQYSAPAPQAPVQQQYQQQYQQPAQSQYQQPAQPQYQQPAQPQYQQQYQQPVQQPVQQYTQPQQYQQPSQYQQQYQEPQQYQQYGQPQYQQPAQYTAPQSPADPYAGSNPAPYDAPAPQGPVDPLAFLNGEGNEGGNQNV